MPMQLERRLVLWGLQSMAFLIYPNINEVVTNDACKIFPEPEVKLWLEAMIDLCKIGSHMHKSKIILSFLLMLR